MKQIRFDFKYQPLQVNKSMTLGGGVPNAQTYDADSGEFSPDYSLVPVCIKPIIGIIDRDRILTNGSVNAQLADVSWRRVIDGVEEKALESTAGKYTITTSGEENGKLLWYINAAPLKPILLRFKATYMDPRTGQIYNIVEDISITCRNATHYIPVLQISGGSSYYNPTRDGDKQTITASLRLGTEECGASKRAFVWEIARSNGYFTEVTADDLELKISSDGATATLDRSLMGEQITIRCRAKYSAAGNPSAVQLTDASPSKVITIARRIPPIDVEVLDAVDNLQPGTRNFSPRAYIYDNVGEIPNPTKDILPIWYFGTNSHTKSIVFVQQGHGLNPVIPTDLMDAKLGGILQIDTKILNPLALLADGDGKVITDGDGKAIVFH
jgi:hypothetical protein|uniref:Uncharacterized protein n=1 Tax=Siphoviridae sp. ctYWp4 TaxID=2826377 RepID=A0A8S5N1Y0_9CAUD|nr:MAG TPA: hypothetical protein [Siphoviridae sp. ctYWp4]